MPDYWDRRLKSPCVYLLSNRRDGILYTGVTSDLYSRMSDHVDGVFEGFTKTHNVKMLVYYEFHETMPAAIQREKRIKEWPRAWKIRLIVGFNPEWINLYCRETGEIMEAPADRQRGRQL
jgi:putative endonuclease